MIPSPSNSVNGSDKRTVNRLFAIMRQSEFGGHAVPCAIAHCMTSGTTGDVAGSDIEDLKTVKFIGIQSSNAVSVMPCQWS